MKIEVSKLAGYCGLNKNVYFNSNALCKMYLSHAAYRQHFSIAIATNIRVNYKNIRKSKQFVKTQKTVCQNAQVNHSLLQRMSPSYRTVTEYQIIHYKNSIKFIFNYMKTGCIFV